MTIKAVLHDGVIRPIEPLPPEWAEGQELVVEEPEPQRTAAEIDQWAQELDESTAQLPTEEHARFETALDEIERESKEAVRKKWGTP